MVALVSSNLPVWVSSLCGAAIMSSVNTHAGFTGSVPMSAHMTS